MNSLKLASSQLLAFVSRIAKPILTGSAATLDKRVDNQLDQALRPRRGNKDAPQSVQWLVPLAHIRTLEADPPLIGWQSPWSCAQDTTIRITHPDGSESHRSLPAGSRIWMTAGLLQFPAGRKDHSAG